jgi:hypothetical protein
MSTIQQAKRSLADRFRSEEGFVGVGLFKRAGEEGLRVYVMDDQLPVARRLASMSSFEGYPVVVEVSGAVQAHRW